MSLPLLTGTKCCDKTRFENLNLKSLSEFHKKCKNQNYQLTVYLVSQWRRYWNLYCRSRSSSNGFNGRDLCPTSSHRCLNLSLCLLNAKAPSSFFRLLTGEKIKNLL